MEARKKELEQAFLSSSFQLSSSISASAKEWLFNQQLTGISLRLEPMTMLLAALGDPQKKRPVLHIAGTNGKGSVSACAAAILKAGGVRVGLYTSPHLVDFRERIQLDGAMITLEDFEEGIRRLQQATQGWKVFPTFFELITALAFDYFARRECEVIVLETGLGGRLDATNLATHKIASAMTPISLDHQEWLGSTLAEIAREKAGIMRPGVPMITALQPEEAMAILQEEASRIGAPLEIITEPLPEHISLGFAGSYQRWNAALALKLVEQGPWKLSQANKEAGLRAVTWPGRFQRLPFFLNSERELILDGAHNSAAARQLVATWKELFPNQQCTLIFGALADKEWKSMLTSLQSISSEIMLVPVNSPRSMSPVEMAAHFPTAIPFSSLKEAFLKKSGKNLLPGKNCHAPILLTGSLFLVGEALSLLEGKVYHSSMQ